MVSVGSGLVPCIAVVVTAFVFLGAHSNASAQDSYGGITGPNYPDPYSSYKSTFNNPAALSGTAQSGWQPAEHAPVRNLPRVVAPKQRGRS